MTTRPPGPPRQHGVAVLVLFGIVCLLIGGSYAVLAFTNPDTSVVTGPQVPWPPTQ